MLAQHVLRQGFKHGHFHRLAQARLVAGHHRSQDGVAGHQPDGAVSQSQGDITGLAPTGLAHQTGDGANALNQVVISRFARVRAVFAIAVKPRINDSGVDGFQAFVRDAQSQHGLGPDVVDHHIGCFHQFEKCVQTLWLFQVQHQAAFVAVHMQKVRPHALMAHGANASDGVARRRLDLDHISAHVRHQLRGIWAHQHTGQIENSQST